MLNHQREMLSIIPNSLLQPLVFLIEQVKLDFFLFDDFLGTTEPSIKSVIGSLQVLIPFQRKFQLCIGNWLQWLDLCWTITTAIL